MQLPTAPVAIWLLIINIPAVAAFVTAFTFGSHTQEGTSQIRDGPERLKMETDSLLAIICLLLLPDQCNRDKRVLRPVILSTRGFQRESHQTGNHELLQAGEHDLARTEANVCNGYAYIPCLSSGSELRVSPFSRLLFFLPNERQGGEGKCFESQGQEIEHDNNI